MLDKTVLSRRAFVLFNRKQAHRVAPGSRCLGWDSLHHLLAIRGCNAKKAWTFVFKPIAEGNATANYTQRRIAGDLSLLRQRLEGQSQVLEAKEILLADTAAELLRTQTRIQVYLALSVEV